METGRKFWMCIIGIICTMFRPDSAPEITAIVIAFCGGNAAISVAHARTQSSHEEHRIEDRRDPVVGFEPTP